MKNIIITGGELFNKGAQAMTFITVSELKKRFPDHRIYVLSELDHRRPQAEKDKYSFEFLGWHHIQFAQAQKNPFIRAKCLLRHRKEYEEVTKIYRNTDLMVDISGYGLGANWDYKNERLYFEHLEYAKCFDIPMYLLPQSFGPFPFTGSHAEELNEKAAKLLPCMKLICAREQEGYDALTGTYGLSNVILAGDLVLNSPGIDLASVYKTVVRPDLPVLAENSAVLIPNIRNASEIDEQRLLEIYCGCVRQLLEIGKTVYILRHSDQDQPLSRRIKEPFADDSRVVLLEQEYSFTDLGSILEQCSLAVASRFHSVVCAYKKGVPCIILGWAVKYRDLAAAYHQEEYAFDIRTLDEDALYRAIPKLDASRDEQSRIIKEISGRSNKESIFDRIK